MAKDEEQNVLGSPKLGGSPTGFKYARFSNDIWGVARQYRFYNAKSSICSPILTNIHFSLGVPKIGHGNRTNEARGVEI